MRKIYFFALLALIPIVGTAIADIINTTVFNNRVVSHLYDLIEGGTYTVQTEHTTHHFDTVLQNDGWYYSTIKSIPKEGEPISVSFKFRANSDDTYTLLAPEVGVSDTFALHPLIPDRGLSLLDRQYFISKSLYAMDSHSPYDLSDSTTQECLAWTDSWSVQSSPSDYIDEVTITWDGEQTFRYYCLFPYNNYDTHISYELQVANSVHGEDNFDEGYPPYSLTGNWQYSSITMAYPTNTTIADTTNTIIFDNHVMSYLHTLSKGGSYYSQTDYVTHHFDTVFQNDGWYHSTIKSIPKEGEPISVSFKFRANSDDTYTLLAPEVGVSGTFAEHPITPDIKLPLPALISIQSSDIDTYSPYDLSANETQNCLFWTSTWSAQSSTSDYPDYVTITWDGEQTFMYYCIFPYNISKVSIEFQGKNRATVSGWDNMAKGLPPYTLSGNWQYSRAI